MPDAAKLLRVIIALTIFQFIFSKVETEMADVTVRDINPAQTYQNTQGTRDSQRFPNGKLKFSMYFLPSAQQDLIRTDEEKNFVPESTTGR